jgi:hypothetical protein
VLSNDVDAANAAASNAAGNAAELNAANDLAAKLWAKYVAASDASDVDDVSSTGLGLELGH